jgi:hypothetical protein
MCINYSEPVSLALGIQHVMGMHHIVNMWPALLYSIFPHFLKKGTIFEKKVTI